MTEIQKQAEKNEEILLKNGRSKRTDAALDFRDSMAQNMAQIASAMGVAVSSPKLRKFERVAMTSVRLNPYLLECDKASLFGAFVMGAQLDLSFDASLGEAYIVPWKHQGELKANFILGYRGIISLAMRSGKVSHIEARCVYEGDEIDFAYGVGGESHLRHVPADYANGQPEKAYAIVTMTDKSQFFEMTLPRHVEAAKKASKGASKGTSPWQTHPEAMWRKTAIRRLEPFLPLRAEERKAFVADSRSDDPGQGGFAEVRIDERTDPLGAKD